MALKRLAGMGTALVAGSLLASACEAEPGPGPAEPPVESPSASAWTSDPAGWSHEALGLSSVAPHRADTGLEVWSEQARLGVQVSLVGATSSMGRLEGGRVIYDAAYGDGAMVIAATPQGVEDHVEVHRGRQLRYRVALDGVAGLRAVGGALELLDAAGTPRLRVAPPRLVDAAGTSRGAELSIEGCAVDRDARSPFRRPVVGPGAGSCELRVTWDPSELSYPVLVDPSWESPRSMLVGRAHHTLTPTHGGLLLAVGGVEVSGSYALNTLKTTYTSAHTVELYDPSSDTWAIGPALPYAVAFHTATRLPHDDVLIVGGKAPSSSNGAAVMRWTDIGGGVTDWVPESSLAAGRSEHSATLLPDGKVLVVGGLPSTAEVFSLGQGWVTLPPAPAPVQLARRRHSADLVDGKVVIVGGLGGAGSIGLGTTAIYDPLTSAFVEGPALAQQRFGHATAVVGTELIVAGGKPSKSAPMISWSERIQSNGMGGFTVVAEPALLTPRANFTLDLLGGLSPLAVGGGECFDDPSCTATATSEIRDGEAPLGWFANSPLAQVRAYHASAALPDGSVVIAGGISCVGTGLVCVPPSCLLPDLVCTTPSSSRRILPLAVGQPCSYPAECGSGFCVDGFCCNAACDEACHACSVALTVTAQSGQCAPRPAGVADAACPTQPVASCGTTGACAAGGACAMHPEGASCSGPNCVGELLTTASCMQGSCVPDSISCAPWGCGSDACGSTCAVDGDCAPSAFCDAGVCTPKRADGKLCAGPGECVSGFCTEGVCCNAACDGQCERCAIPDEEGICLPVAGAAPVGKPACGIDDPSEPCTERLCDGVERMSCAGFVGQDVACRTAGCEDGDRVAAAACQGDGTCAPPVSTPCAPYLCAEGACLESCQGEADCVAGFTCLDGSCAPPASCRDDRTVEAASGDLLPCETGYRCQGGECATACDDATACLEGFVCDPDRRCVPMPTDDLRIEGSCAMAPPGSLRPWWLLLGLVAWRRRRR